MKQFSFIMVVILQSMGGSGTSENYEYRSRSPLSPAREVRMRERQEIQGLNSRLAGYIDRVRKLETENDALRVSLLQIRHVFVCDIVTSQVNFFYDH